MVNSDHAKLSQQILSLAPDAILFADRGGIIRIWNKGAERIFGSMAEEAIGQSLDLIIPEKLQGRHWDGYRKTMATGETRYGTDLLAVPAQHQDGSRISTEFSIVLLRDEKGDPFGVAAILRDVSPQRQREKGLQDRIAELEAELQK
jgi:PAS domain S-box-containing protein